jgi:hypothetical protein
VVVLTNDGNFCDVERSGAQLCDRLFGAGMAVVNGNHAVWVIRGGIIH